MTDFRISNLFVLLLVSFNLASCVQHKTTPPVIEEIVESAVPKSDVDNIYIAWNGGIGGTGISGDDHGIGGTGIIGTISGFGSIIVNGIHIDYESTQKLESLLGEKTAASLAIGHVVAVEAELVKGQFVARRIIEQIALFGTVESIDITTGEIKVVGERVLVLPNNNGASLAIEDIKVGAQIAISGIRDTDVIYASQISPVSRSAAAFASGTVTAIEGEQVTIDNSRRFRVPENSGVALKIGDFVGIRNIGNKTKGRQTISSIERVYGQMFDGQVTRTAVEGFFAPHKAAALGVNPLQKGRASRQVIFKIKDAKHRVRNVGSVELDRKNWQNPRFETRSQDSKKQSETANPDRIGRSAGRAFIKEIKGQVKAGGLTKQEAKTQTEAVRNTMPAKPDRDKAGGGGKGGGKP